MSPLLVAGSTLSVVEGHTHGDRFGRGSPASGPGLEARASRKRSGFFPTTSAPTSYGIWASDDFDVLEVRHLHDGFAAGATTPWVWARLRAKDGARTA